MKEAIIELITDNTGVSTEQAKAIANEILKLQKKVYVVLSRDRDYIYCTTDEVKAKKAKKEQERKEEFAGGRPNVYIRTTNLN